MTRAAWQRHKVVAVVESAHRTAIVNLAALHQPPVVLAGSAWLVYDAVDGARDTAGILASLRADFPDETGLGRQVSDCLDALERAGLISRTLVTPA